MERFKPNPDSRQRLTAVLFLSLITTYLGSNFFNYFQNHDCGVSYGTYIEYDSKGRSVKSVVLASSYIPTCLPKGQKQSNDCEEETIAKYRTSKLVLVPDSCFIDTRPFDFSSLEIKNWF